MLRLRFQAAAVFNCMFAILATVTLLGIVLITRPRQPLHNIPPTWWIPISCIFIPGLVAAQVFTWRAHKKRKILSPIEIAKTHRLPQKLRLGWCCFWFLNYVNIAIVLISLYQPDPNRGFDVASFLLVITISSFITTTGNVFLLLVARSIAEQLEDVICKSRHVFTAATAIAGVVYYYVLK